VEDTQATLAAIPGAKGGRMTGIGHFPVSENYPRFKEYLQPILAELSSV
jgi:hypothetical protein